MPVDTVRKEYDAFKDDWRMCRDVLAGSKAVKEAGTIYLPKLSDQDHDDYSAYKMRAKFYAATARTREALVGLVFSKPLSVNAPEVVKAHLRDVTLDATSLDDLAVTSFGEVLGVARLGILLDMHGDDIAQADRRPFWSLYRTEQIVNWRETADDGDTQLEMVVLRETIEEPEDAFSVKCIEQYRVLALIDGVYTITKWRQEGQDGNKKWVAGTPVVPVRREAPLDFIPFMIVGPTTLRPGPEKPPLRDMADINLALYRRSADLEHGRHFTALPQPWVVGFPSGGSKLRIGSGVAWTLDVGGEAGYLEFTGQGLGALVEGVKEDKEEMAALGSDMFAEDQQGEETATAARMRHGAKSASLKTMAGRLGSALTTVLRWHAWWCGAAADIDTEAIEVKVNTEFIDTKLTPEEHKTLLLAVQASRMSFETYYYHLERGELTRPGVTFEEERAAIESDAELDGIANGTLDENGDPIPPDPNVDENGDPLPPGNAGGKKPAPKPGAPAAKKPAEKPKPATKKK